MKLMLNDAQRNQSIYIEQISHGKSVRISATSLLVKMGASGPALSAGNPVMGSITISIL